MLNLNFNIPTPVLLNRKTNEVRGENQRNEEREKGHMSNLLVRFIKDHTLKPVFYYENLHLKEKKEFEDMFKKVQKLKSKIKKKHLKKSK